MTLSKRATSRVEQAIELLPRKYGFADVKVVAVRRIRLREVRPRDGCGGQICRRLQDPSLGGQRPREDHLVGGGLAEAKTGRAKVTSSVWLRSMASSQNVVPPVCTTRPSSHQHATSQPASGVAENDCWST